MFRKCDLINSEKFQIPTIHITSIIAKFVQSKSLISKIKYYIQNSLCSLNINIVHQFHINLYVYCISPLGIYIYQAQPIFFTCHCKYVFVMVFTLKLEFYYLYTAVHYSKQRAKYQQTRVLCRKFIMRVSRQLPSSHIL